MRLVIRRRGARATLKFVLGISRYARTVVNVDDWSDLSDRQKPMMPIDRRKRIGGGECHFDLVVGDDLAVTR